MVVNQNVFYAIGEMMMIIYFPFIYLSIFFYYFVSSFLSIARYSFHIHFTVCVCVMSFFLFAIARKHGVVFSKDHKMNSKCRQSTVTQHSSKTKTMKFKSNRSTQSGIENFTGNKIMDYINPFPRLMYNVRCARTVFTVHILHTVVAL